MELTTPSPTVKAPDARFTGDVYINPIKKVAEPSRLMVSIVRFTPGARTNWHSHAVGQTLWCTDGAGIVVNRAGKVIRLTPGDTIWTPPGEEHWHGAGTDCMMSHLAMLEGVEGSDGASWLEPVTDEEYARANQ